MKYFNKYIINKILIIMLLSVSIFFPFDFFELKKITFILLIVLNLKCLLEGCRAKRNFFITFYGLIFPTILVLISSILTLKPILAMNRAFSMYLLLLLFILKKYEINYRKICLKIVTILMIFILFLALTDLLGIFDINDSVITKFIYKYEMGFVGKSEQYSFYYKIFLRTSPLIIILLFDCFEKRKKILFSMTYLALIFTGTRANIGIAAIGIIVCIFYKLLIKKNKTIFLYNVIAILILMVLIILLLLNIELLINIFITKSSSSDIIRIGHLNGFYDSLKFNKSFLWLGSGLGSSFFSYSVGWVSSIELSYIDLIRQIGLPLFIVYAIFLIYPILNIKKYEYKAFLLCTYLLIAATNPLLVSSTGYILYIFVYYQDIEEGNNVS